MLNIVDGVLDTVDSFLAWLSASLHQTMESYCDVETADSPTVLVTHDGSLMTIIKVDGITTLLGNPEFQRLHEGLTLTLQSAMSRKGHAFQVLFNYDSDQVVSEITEIFAPARETSKRLGLDLDDLFEERIRYIANYCGHEGVFFVLWTRPTMLNKEQLDRANKEKSKVVREAKLPLFKRAQNVLAPIPDLRDTHDAFVRSLMNDFLNLSVRARVLEVHEAVYQMRMTVDPDFTDKSWKPVLAGDKIPVKDYARFTGEITDFLWPPLSKQIMPRDAENMDMRTVRIGDKIYASMFIDLFPKDIKMFMYLMNRTLAASIPWRISFLVESDGLSTIKFKSVIASVLSFTSAQNRLLSDSKKLLEYLEINTDDAIVRLRVAACTWAPEGDVALLRTRTSELSKAIEGWGSCDVSEMSGDPFAGAASSMLGVTLNSIANASVAPLSDVVYMLPITRPASPWKQGALLFRTPDGKPWPFQPGSSEQTTWIDLIFARPGSGKSVLSNAINLGLCLSAGLTRLPRIAVIDIGPSSSGLISLLKEALPQNQRHYVAYHRLRMTPDYSINPFDTQLGCRFPTPQERGFLVNFVTLLTTPVGAAMPYDGISDMAGMVVDELYKNLADSGNPYQYTAGIEPLVDGILEEIGFVQDQKTTWWEVVDALFIAGFLHEAGMAQRYAMPLVADAASICRSQNVEDLFGKIIAPTGETLINSFARMISGAVREYPVLSRVTTFDLGEAKIVSLDLDEVAKGGGDAADRQTAVMYMLARYILAKTYYLTEDNVTDMPEQYREYHRKRIGEIREDPKRLVMDEFHRTSKARAVRDQVIVDMREGRKWKVHIALISQSLDDFDETMVEFATGIYIMDAGPQTSVEKSAKIFGLSETAQVALRTRVHGPREGGGTFLVQYATKEGINLQLVTSTLGPIELWSFSTTVEDALLRNQLYKRIGPKEARRILSTLFPSGSVTKLVEQRLNNMKEKQQGLISETANLSVIDELVDQILTSYRDNPDFKSLPLKD
ncbi:MAG TPA: type IV secretion protein IcmB [Gammaproteobacteria bacterium]|nr:type IV secretion protein IcmB [Gammaproteobacteria bacterium]